MAHVLLYDGVCGLCNRLNRFVLARDRRDVFRFAPLQSPFAREVIARHGRDPDRLETLAVLTDAGDLLVKSRAVFFILRELNAPWRWLSILRFILPRVLVDMGYDRIASIRYRIWGKFDACPVPRPEDRAKFLAGC